MTYTMNATITRNANPGTLMQANREWATRPDDERFTSLEALHAHTVSMRQPSAAQTASHRQPSRVPVEGDHRALAVVGPSGAPVAVSHWAFGQLAQRAGAPAGYLRS